MLCGLIPECIFRLVFYFSSALEPNLRVYIFDSVLMPSWKYTGVLISTLARPGSKPARKDVRDARDLTFRHRASYI